MSRQHEIAQRLQAMAQTGLTYTQDAFDRARYEEIRQLAADMASETLALEPETVAERYALEVGYATPKVDVRGVVFRDNRILLVLEREDGRWTLPGGWADVGQTPSESVVREVWEEAGLPTRALRLLGVWDRNRHGHPPHLYHIFKLFFLCEDLGGEPHAGDETDDARFFAKDQLPPLSLGRVLPKHIEWLYQVARDSSSPCYFD